MLNRHSYKVSATLAAQRFVSAKSAAANEVEYPPANRMPVGITVDSVLDVNQRIPVAGQGEIVKLLFNDTCTAGELVASDTSGRGIAFSLAATTTSLTLPSAYGGILMDETVAATGTIANVLVMPGFVK